MHRISKADMPCIYKRDQRSRFEYILEVSKDSNLANDLHSIDSTLLVDICNSGNLHVTVL
jgi:hypothetical protein